MPDETVDHESTPALPSKLSELDTLRFSHVLKDCELAQLAVTIAERALPDAKTVQAAKQQAYVTLSNELAQRYRITTADEVDATTGAILRGVR